jgi:hypothetical protein
MTYLGGSHTGDRDPDDTVEAVQVDWRGHVYVTGETISPDFPTHRPVQRYSGGAVESYLFRLDPDSKQVVFSTFWGGAKRDYGTAVALGPGENVTVVGESASDNLPLQHAFRKQFGPSTDGFMTRFCDPWPGAYPSSNLQFSHTLGASEAPAPQTLEVLTGCAVAHDVEIQTDQPWVRLRYEGRTAPLKLTVETDTTALAAGEHKAEVRITVPAAFRKELTIPVTLTVAEPPAVD